MHKLILALPLAFLATPAFAQADFSKVEIKAEQLAPGVAVLFGAGGNIGVSYGADGTVLIDDQFAPLTPKIESAVAALGASPIKFLINTHWHFDHSGGNENLGRKGAIIMAHENVRVRLVKGAQMLGQNIPPAPKEALPVITYQDGIKLHLNGDEVRTIHTGGGHTDGDSIVVWKNANIIHTGDLFNNNGGFPFVDTGSGGNAVHLVETLNKIIPLTNETTRIIPGHGPMAKRADLVAWRGMISSVIASVRAGVKAKKTLAQIKAMKPAAKWDTNPKAFITGDAFVEAIYKSIMAPMPGHHRH
jgi:cyclase